MEKRLPNSGFRLLYPKEARGDDPDLYVKIQKKATEMWQMSTGTVTKMRQTLDDPKMQVKKKKIKKNINSQSASSKVPSFAKKNKLKNESVTEMDSQEEGDESNWQGASEDIKIERHL